MNPGGFEKHTPASAHVPAHASTHPPSGYTRPADATPAAVAVAGSIKRRWPVRHRAAFDAAPIAMVIFDHDGQIVLVNRETERLFGHPRDALIGHCIERLMPDAEQAIRSQLGDAISQSPFPRRLDGRCQLAGRRHDGSEFPVEVALATVETEQGELILATVSDLTERRRVEDELREAVHRRDRFLAILSHELRNPLSAAQTSVSLLSTEGVPPNVCAEALDVLNRQIRHITRLLDDLLDVSRFTQDKLQVRKATVDLVATARDALAEIRVLAQENGSTISDDLPQEPLWVYGDPDRLVQMQANVLANAVKYSPAGGPISLSLQRQGAEAVIVVRDQGIGIPADMLDAIFDMFVQSGTALERSQGGMGVGLTLVRSIVQLHGGTVVARSEGEGCGSEFEIRLPLTSPAPAASEECTPARSGRRCRILLVEDQNDTRAMLGKLLTVEGHEVQQAADGFTALKLFEEKQPEVAILDLGLPGLSGIELARRMRAARPGKPLCLIALTGYGQTGDMEATRQAGFDHHLVKPFSVQCLLKLLEQPGHSDNA